MSLAEFQNIDIRICTVRAAERVPATDKLLKLTVDCGEEKTRTIISGIAEHISPDTIVGMQCPFVVNLDAREIRGETSEGMILAASGSDGSFSLLRLDTVLPPGSRVR